MLVDDAFQFDAVVASELVDQISPLLVGRGPAMQMAVLGDLVAMCIAGQIALGDNHQIDAESTHANREEQLRLFIALVRDLIPINAEAVMHRLQLKEGRPQ